MSLQPPSLAEVPGNCRREEQQQRGPTDIPPPRALRRGLRKGGGKAWKVATEKRQADSQAAEKHIIGRQRIITILRWQLTRSALRLLRAYMSWVVCTAFLQGCPCSSDETPP